MIRKFAVLVLFLFSGIFSFTQEFSINTEEKLLALERMWGQAQLLHDAGALDHLIGPNFINTEWDGTVSGRQKFLADIKDPLFKPITMNIQNVVVQQYGSAAIVTGTYHAKGFYRDKSYDHMGRFTDTWILQAGRWQCVASQSSLINTNLTGKK